MRRFTSYLIDGNIIAAFILTPSFVGGYTSWQFHELLFWYLLLSLILYIRHKIRQFRFG